MATGDSLIPDGIIDNFKLSDKATVLHSTIRSTDSDTNPGSPTWAPGSETLDSVNNRVVMTNEAVGNVVLVITTTRNKPFNQCDPKPVLAVEPKVIASNSHSVYKDAMITAQVTGRIATGSSANGFESKVLENVGIDVYEAIVTVNETINFTQGKRYKFLVDEYDQLEYDVILIWSDTSGTYTPLSNWNLLANEYSMLTTPAHNTLQLSNDTSSAAKWMNVLEEEDGELYAGIYGTGLVSNGGVYDGDDGTFEQLTNGTLTDLNGNTVKTFHGSSYLGIRVK